MKKYIVFDNEEIWIKNNNGMEENVWMEIIMKNSNMKIICNNDIMTIIILILMKILMINEMKGVKW